MGEDQYDIQHACLFYAPITTLANYNFTRRCFQLSMLLKTTTGYTTNSHCKSNDHP